MNKDVIYIEPEDDITSIIRKLNSSEHKLVALVPPKRIGVLRSAVNTRLIAKNAKQSGKTVVIVSSDPSLTKLSAAAGIPVADTLQSRPKLPDDILDAPAKEAIPSEITIEEGKLTVNEGETTTDADGAEVGIKEETPEKARPAKATQKIDDEINSVELEAEAKKGFDGRFGAGLPRKSDGQLLFIQHMISKMKTNDKSKIAVITNGSPLFTGDAGSGESNIRKWIFENDYLEALIALPNQLFFNTGIGTYIWVLTNKKTPQRKGKVQLIDAREEFESMRKSLGDKRQFIPEESIKKIINTYNDFTVSDKVKIFDNEDFGYTKITVERPMQLNYQVSQERLENLYSYSAFKKLADEEEGKKQQEAIKEALLTIGDDLYTTWDTFEAKVKKSLKPFDLKPAFIKNVIEKLSEHDETADYVTDKKGNPKPDSNLRDTEKIPLIQNIDDYFEDKVQKYYSDAWYDDKKNKVGYEINFTQYFYVYEPPRPLEEIESDISKVTAEIQDLLR